MCLVDPNQLAELRLRLSFIVKATPVLDDDLCDDLCFAGLPASLHRQTFVAELAIGKTKFRLESHLSLEPAMYGNIAMKRAGRRRHRRELRELRLQTSVCARLCKKVQNVRWFVLAKAFSTLWISVERLLMDKYASGIFGTRRFTFLSLIIGLCMAASNALAQTAANRVRDSGCLRR